jgi:hypothetical protein
VPPRLAICGKYRSGFFREPTLARCLSVSGGICRARSVAQSSWSIASADPFVSGCFRRTRATHRCSSSATMACCKRLSPVVAVVATCVRCEVVARPVAKSLSRHFALCCQRAVHSAGFRCVLPQVCGVPTSTVFRRRDLLDLHSLRLLPAPLVSHCVAPRRALLLRLSGRAKCL